MTLVDHEPASAHGERIAALGSMPVLPLLLRFFGSALTGVLVMSLYNIVDRIFIGQGVGPLAIAGLSVIFPIMLIQIAFGLLLGIGGAVRASISLGRGERDEAERILGHDFLLMLSAGLGIMVLGFGCREWLLHLFGATEETIGYAGEYFDVVLVAAPFSLVGYSLNHFIRAEGHARIAMLSMLLSAAVNMGLDALFIFGFGWGVRGAAYATLASQVVLAGWVLYHYWGGRSQLRLRRAYMRWDGGVAWSIGTAGFSVFAMQLANSLIQSTFNRQLVSYGSDYALSAIGIVNSVSQLLLMSVVALNQAAQPIYGYNQGAYQHRRLRQCLSLCLGFSFGIGTLGMVVVQLFPDWIVRLFDAQDAELLSAGRTGLRLFFLAFPLIAFQVVVSGYFQSVGRVGTAALVALLRQLAILLPLLCILPSLLGLRGVWLSAPLSDALSALVSAGFLVCEYRRLGRCIRNGG